MSSNPQSPQRRQTTGTNSWNHRIPAEMGETENWESLDILGWTSLVYTVHLETTRQALSQTRWRVRTKACPLTLTHAWRHVGTYIHTHEWVHTNTCCVQMVLNWQIPFFFFSVMLNLNCSCSDFKWVFKGLCSYGHSLFFSILLSVQIRDSAVTTLSLVSKGRGNWPALSKHLSPCWRNKRKIKMNQFSHFINFVCIWFRTFFPKTVLYLKQQLIFFNAKL